MNINTVKMSVNGYIVNGHSFVPMVEGNYHYKAIQLWIDAGNTPEPQYTAQELLEKEQREVRADRDKRLSEEVDPYQGVLRYNELTPVQQNQIAQYRRDLLDLPQQAGFSNDPKGLVFPGKPDWV